MELKPCVRCNREIDALARLCVYCNWRQNETPPQRSAAAPAAAPIRPVSEHRLRKPLLGLVGIIALLIVSFTIGIVVHGKNPPPVTKESGEPAPEAAGSGKPVPRANVTLVPVNEAMPNLETPITSAPAANAAQGLPAAYQRSDATAVSSEEYAQLARRVQQEKQSMNLVDPRAIRGAAYREPPPPPRRREERVEEPVRIARTNPIPESQPVPRLRFHEPATARLELKVGTDGRVDEINIRRSLPHDMVALLRAVQSWRFKPATANGVPVEAPFTVDISFQPNE
jgi:TonB family protein